jgi:putative flippase GtrA
VRRVDLPPALRRLGRYGIASVVSTLVGTALLAAFVGVFRWPAAVANLAAAGICLGPLYLVSRRWVWNCEEFGGVLTETIPFFVVSLASVLASSAVGGGVEAWSRGLRLSHLAETGLVVACISSTYALLWLLRFFLLDRVLFPSRIRTQAISGSLLTAPAENASLLEKVH